MDEIKRAQNIIKAYARDLEGLTLEECADENFSPGQCEVLVQALGKGSEGHIEEAEADSMEQAGISQKFILELTGKPAFINIQYGHRALENRIRWMGENKKGIDELIQILAQSSSTYPAEASHALKEIGEEAIPKLKVLLRSVDKSTREKAVSVLGQIGPQAAICVPDILRMYDYDANTYRIIETAISHIGPAAIPYLVEALKNEPFLWPLVLPLLGASGKEAAFPLLSLLHHGDENVRAGAATALGNIAGRLTHPDDSEADLLEVIVAALRVRLARESDVNVQKNIIMAFGRIGPPAVEVFPDLLEFIHDKKQNLILRQLAISTLHYISNQSEGVEGVLIEVLVSILEDEKGGPLTDVAVAVLADLGVAAEPAQSALEAIVVAKQNNLLIMQNAVLALSHIGVETLPTLIFVFERTVSDQDCCNGKFLTAFLYIVEHTPEKERLIPLIPVLQNFIATQNDPYDFERSQAQEILNALRT